MPTSKKLPLWLLPLALGAAVSACGRDSSQEKSKQGESGGAGVEQGSGGAIGAGGHPGSGGRADTGGGSGEFSGVPGAEGFDCSASEGEVPVLQASSLWSDGFNEPMWISFEPGGASKRLFVVERGGKIQILEGGLVASKPFIDISTKVSTSNERGLLGLAFHPQFPKNGLFYLHYSEAGSGDTIIEEYTRSEDSELANPDSGRRLLRVEQPYGNHNGGAINFGKDGYLYIGLGDGGDGGDPHDHGQNLDSLLGKMLRIDPTEEGGMPYQVPSGNLSDNVATAKPEIWDYGLRNPFRSSFDGCTGDLYIGDVGQNSWEELDIEPAGQGQRNYGWNTAEGDACFEPSAGCDQSTLAKPAWVYDRDAGQSITGGAVYRGRELPALRGAYFFADYASGAIWSTFYDPKTGETSRPISHTSDLSNVKQVVAINNGPDGELYFVSLKGMVYKLESAM